ncbi:MAG: hypothetical protein KF810_17315 [Rhizobiaceae bacterium]|nr:hypothetical protein [Rhizobiaceae bacterium]
MTFTAVILLLLAGALRTRLGRLYLARYLLRAGNVLGEAGSRVLDQVKRERM